KHRDAAVDLAPGRRRARPVATRDLARIELDRIGNAAEPRMVLHPLVELARVAAQRLDQAERREDRVGAALAVLHVHRPAAQLEAEPHHADGAAIDLRAGWFRNEAGVGPIAARER